MNVGFFQAVYNSDLSHRARVVYMCLKDHADKQGVCWPGIRTIMRELNLSRRTVQRALKELEQSGLIKRTPRYRENGGRSSDFYSLSDPQ